MVSKEMCHDESCVMMDQMRFHGGFSGCYSLVLHPLVVGGCGLGVQAAKACGGLDGGRAEHSEYAMELLEEESNLCSRLEASRAPES